MTHNLSHPADHKTSDELFNRVVDILNHARSNATRSVNTQMVTAYWLIGREIVQALQAGQERAAYGKQVVQNLSASLKAQFGRGYSPSVFGVFDSFINASAIAHL